ncbi:MAG TPA: hypothetical protein PKI70_06850, partial [Mesotoga sp.]|nr:hypothetical protein [Mesotoga sp.]
RTSSEIESNDGSMRFIPPRPEAIPSEARPVKPGRRILSKRESFDRENHNKGDAKNHIFLQSQAEPGCEFGRNYQLDAFLKESAPRQASLPNEL